MIQSRLVLRPILLIKIPAGKRTGRRLIDKKLTAVRIRSGIRHRQRTADIEQSIAEFILKGLSPNTVAAGSIAVRISALDHKVVDHTMKGQAVVITILGMGFKILYRLGSGFREKPNTDIPHTGVHNRNFFPFLGHIQLITYRAFRTLTPRKHSEGKRQSQGANHRKNPMLQ